IESFPGGHDTSLGERGVTPSGGHRHPTPLARALARGARILILDDSLSAVDTETESRILQVLREVQQGRTVLLTSHRVSTLRHADHIVVLEAGRIVEQGSHAGLLALGGHYAELERRQRLESDLELDTAPLPASGDGGGEAVTPAAGDEARASDAGEDLDGVYTPGASEVRPPGAGEDMAAELQQEVRR
ncbi:MAG: hypothetical protein ACR2J4_10050, partial [Deinococcus sp.]